MMRDYSVIGGETITIRRTNHRTLPFIYVALVFGVAFPAMYFFNSPMSTMPWFTFLPALAILILYLRVWGLLTTITIGPEGVRFKSLTADRLYPWREIKSAGMYVQRRGIRVLQRHEFKEKFYLALKYVWFSRSEFEQPGAFSFPGYSYCDFEFRQDAWELFNKYLVGNPDPDKLPGFDRFVTGEPHAPNHWMH